MKKCEKKENTRCQNACSTKKKKKKKLNKLRKRQLKKSHAVISSPSTSHSRRSRSPVGWFDILSSSWLCFLRISSLFRTKKKKKKHTHCWSLHQGFSLFYRSVKTGQKKGDADKGTVELLFYSIVFIYIYISYLMTENKSWYWLTLDLESTDWF